MIGMFARKAVAQSLAREFGPQGIHVSHVIIDGMIDTPGLRERMGEDKDEKVRLFWYKQGGSANEQRLNPDDIAEVGPFSIDVDDLIFQTYLSLINQPRSAWTHELDIRCVWNCALQEVADFIDRSRSPGRTEFLPRSMFSSTGWNILIEYVL